MTSSENEKEVPTATPSRAPSVTKVANEIHVESDASARVQARTENPEKLGLSGAQEEEADAEEGVHVNYPSTPKLALLTIGLCLVIFVVSAPLFA